MQMVKLVVAVPEVQVPSCVSSYLTHVKWE